MLNNRAGLAKRNVQDAIKGQAGHHSDGMQYERPSPMSALADDLKQANCITGFSISNWLTLGFSFAPKDVAWRFPLAFQVFFTLCIFCLCPFLPDSPRLLIRKGKSDEAREVLAALEGHGATPESASVQAQFSVIKDILDREHVNTYSWWQLITGRGPSGLMRRMILGAWMQAMNQISGKSSRIDPGTLPYTVLTSGNHQASTSPATT